MKTFTSIFHEEVIPVNEKDLFDTDPKKPISSKEAKVLKKNTDTKVKLHNTLVDDAAKDYNKSNTEEERKAAMSRIERRAKYSNKMSERSMKESFLPEIELI